jgi:hypothetical protein
MKRRARRGPAHAHVGAPAPFERDPACRSAYAGYGELPQPKGLQSARDSDRTKSEHGWVPMTEPTRRKAILLSRGMRHWMGLSNAGSAGAICKEKIGRRVPRLGGFGRTNPSLRPHGGRPAKPVRFLSERTEANVSVTFSERTEANPGVTFAGTNRTQPKWRPLMEENAAASGISAWLLYRGSQSGCAFGRTNPRAKAPADFGRTNPSLRECLKDYDRAEA